MPHFQDFHGWMKFNHLDASECIEAFYSIIYRITDDSSDAWTSRANSFKAKDTASYWGATFLMREAVKSLIRHLDVNVSRALFVPVLGSQETTASPNSHMSVIAKQSADMCGASYSNSILTKRLTERYMKCLGVPADEMKSLRKLTINPPQQRRERSFCLMILQHAELPFRPAQRQSWLLITTAKSTRSP